MILYNTVIMVQLHYHNISGTLQDRSTVSWRGQHELQVSSGFLQYCILYRGFEQAEVCPFSVTHISSSCFSGDGMVRRMVVCSRRCYILWLKDARGKLLLQTGESPSCVNNGTCHGRLEKAVECRNVPMKYSR